MLAILLYYIASFENVFGRFSTRPLGVIEVITNDRKKNLLCIQVYRKLAKFFFLTFSIWCGGRLHLISSAQKSWNVFVCLFHYYIFSALYLWLFILYICVLFVISSIPWLGQKELTDVIPHRRNLCALCYYLLSTNRVSRNAKSRTNFRPTEKNRPDQQTYTAGR